MKKSLRIGSAVAVFLALFGQSAFAHTYYWQGGTGNWHDPLKWRIVAGVDEGVPTSAFPTATDDVYFDATAGFVNEVRGQRGAIITAESKTVTITQNAVARNIYWTGLSVIPFFQINAPLTLHGSLIMNSPVVITSTSAGTLAITSSLVFNATANNASMTMAGPVSVGTNLTVSSPASIVPNNGLSVGGTVSITSTGASLAFNSPVTIGGSFTLAAAGNLSGTAGSLTLTSTSTNTRLGIPATPPAIGSPFTIAVPVTFNGVGGRWTLQGSMTVTNRANFVNGHVVALPPAFTNPLNPNGGLPPTNPTESVTDSPKLSFGLTARVTGAKHSSHVIGYVEKIVAKDSPEFEFPIGNGTYYRPAISNVASSDNALLARYLSVAPAKPVPTEWNKVVMNAPLNSVSDREFWYFNAPNNSSPGMRVNATHPDPTIAQYYHLDKIFGITIAGLSTDSSKPPTATWSDQNATTGVEVTTTIDPVTGLTNYWVKAFGISNSINWITIGRRGNTPMPVRLVSFTGQQLDGQVQLKWQSSEEKNTSHFEVERSADGKHFSQVLTKKAQGNSASLVSYNAIDNTPLAGTSYYRLKMVDLDGTFEHSRMVAVSAEGTLLVKAYPNPSKGNGVNIIAGDGSTLVLKAVSDLFGKQVSYRTGSSSTGGLQVSFTQPLPAGFYVATLAGSDNGPLVKVKFVVQ